MIKIVSIVSNECIPVDRKLQWFIDDNQFIYFETFNTLYLNLGTDDTMLDVGDCMLAQRLSLYNFNSFPTFIRAVKLQVEEEELTRCIEPVISRLDPSKGSLLKNIFSPLFHDYSQLNKVEELVSQLLTDWFMQVSPKANPPHSVLHGNIDSRLIKVNRYLRQHCEETITLQQLADIIHCNPVYLSNVYSKVFHISPMKHLQMMKMEKAKILLNSTRMSVKEISMRLGYASASQFSNLFKRYNGVTPLLFKNNSGLSSHEKQY